MSKYPGMPTDTTSKPPFTVIYIGVGVGGGVIAIGITIGIILRKRWI